MCRNVNKKYLKLEAFQDNIDKEAKHAGSIFCDTLNGKMLGFPNTMTELSDIIDYKEELMALTSLDDLEITINSKSYSQENPWPEIEYSEGYLDMYEMYGRLCQKKRYLGLCLPYGMHINQKRNSAILWRQQTEKMKKKGNWKAPSWPKFVTDLGIGGQSAHLRGK